MTSHHSFDIYYDLQWHLLQGLQDIQIAPFLFPFSLCTFKEFDSPLNKKMQKINATINKGEVK